MSAYVHVKCKCAHRVHRGQCPHRACGCLHYRPKSAELPPLAPRVIRAVVLASPKAVTW